MWCLMEFQHDLRGQCLPQGKENLLLKDILCLKARLFWGSSFKTKHQSLTSVAFMLLVPGADRVVRHICIRCMSLERAKIVM